MCFVSQFPAQMVVGGIYLALKFRCREKLKELNFEKFFANDHNLAKSFANDPNLAKSFANDPNLDFFRM